jgi:Glycosyl hydrolase family 12
MAPSHKLASIAKRPAARRYAVAMVAASCVVAVALVLVYRGQLEVGKTRVPLLPDVAAKGQTWDWTASCALAPVARGGCEGSGPNLGSAQLDGDEWNLGGGLATTGSLAMSLSPAGALVVKGDLPSAPPCTQPSCLAPSANTWVRGYPSVVYGLSQCHANTSPPTSPLLPLPTEVRAIGSDLIGTTRYSWEGRQVTYDIAYDMWLNPSATKSPCHTDGTVEVMVWTDYDQRALLPQTMGVGVASVPFAVDGAEHGGTDAWSLYASNIYDNGQTAPWGGTIWFVLNAADVVPQGTISINLSAVLSAVGKLLEADYGWSDFADRYWLETIPFGMEFGPQSTALSGTGPSYFSLRLSSFCLNAHARLAHAPC